MEERSCRVVSDRDGVRQREDAAACDPVSGDPGAAHGHVDRAEDALARAPLGDPRIDDALRGLGHSLEPALLTVLGTCVFRLVWIFFVMPVFPGYEQLMWVYPISWLLTTLLVFTAYLRISRKAFALHCHDKSAE